MDGQAFEIEMDEVEPLRSVSIKFEWTEARVEHLKERWGDGARTKMIADELGTTKNSVIGKIDRLGLSEKIGPRPPKKQADPMAAVRRSRSKPQRDHDQKHIQEIRVRRSSLTQHVLHDSKPPQPLPDEDADQAIPFEQRKSILQLTEDTCRWPVGEVGSPGFFFCGAPSLGCRPYCAGHMRVSYR